MACIARVLLHGYSNTDRGECNEGLGCCARIEIRGLNFLRSERLSVSPNAPQNLPFQVEEGEELLWIQ